MLKARCSLVWKNMASVCRRLSFPCAAKTIFFQHFKGCVGSNLVEGQSALIPCEYQYWFPLYLLLAWCIYQRSVPIGHLNQKYSSVLPKPRSCHFKRSFCAHLECRCQLLLSNIIFLMIFYNLYKEYQRQKSNVLFSIKK